MTGDFRSHDRILRHKQNCSYRSYIASYIDKTLDTKTYLFMRRHILSCPNCRKGHQDFQQAMNKVRRLIPQKEVTESMLESIKVELKDIFEREQGLKKGLATIKKTSRIKRISSRIMKDIAQTIFAKEMIKIYLVAIIFFVGLHFLSYSYIFS